MRSYFKLSFTAAFFLLIQPCLLFSQKGADSHSISAISEALNQMEVSYPRQKAYLHTDKDEYIAGENIWLKAYLTDAATHIPDTVSTNLNVELVNTEGDPASIKLLRMSKGYSHANITLPDSLPEGNYQLRAYTNWMQNFSSDFFFKKELFIHNPVEKNFIRRREIRQNRRFNDKLAEKAETMQFAFFPEGGNPVSGLENRVAFKAADALGSGQHINGKLFDNKGNTILDFESTHNGMGMFSFTPEKEKKYKAIVKFSGGQQKKVKLPEAITKGYLLKTNIDGDQINIAVRTNFNHHEYDNSKDLYILAHIRNKPYFTEKGTIENGVFKTSISLEDLPAGICHITLFDSDVSPVAERLVFVNDNGFYKADINVEETVVDNTGGLSARLFFESYEHEPAEGSYSLSVIGRDELSGDHNSNIVTYLQLTSDIGKTLESPWFYFSGPPAQEAIDLVMMTHGWRRFEWNEILEEEYPETRYDMQTGIILSGKVDAVASDRKVEEQRVELSLKKEGEPVDVYTTKTDDDGYFTFSNLDYSGTVTAALTVETDRRRRTFDLSLKPGEFYLEGFSKSFLTRPLTVLSRGDEWQRVSRPEIFTETHKAISPEHKSISMYGTPDQVVYMEDIRANITNMMQVLRSYVRGLREERGIITLRGVSSIHLSNEPLFMVDGTTVHKNTFLSLNPQEVERIEVFSGPSAAMFGVRGTNGVLIAYTKKTQTGRTPYTEYVLEGYTEADEFYHSKIDVEKNIKTGTPKTIFWKPEIIPDENGYARVDFPLKKDKWDHIKIIVEGIDNKGNITFDKLDL